MIILVRNAVTDDGALTTQVYGPVDPAVFQQIIDADTAGPGGVEYHTIDTDELDGTLDPELAALIGGVGP